MGVGITQGQQPRITSVKAQLVNAAVPANNLPGTTYLVTIAAGQEMPDANYSVIATAREQPTAFGAGANLVVDEAVAATATQFYVRVRNNWSAALPCYMDYVLVQNTPIPAANPAAKFTGDTAWTYPLLSGGWTAYGSGFAPARYRKLITGEVQLQGLIKGGAAGSNIFQLPVGYRPDSSLLFAIQRNANVAGRVDIMADGQVWPQLTDPGWTSLSGIQFYADQ